MWSVVIQSIMAESSSTVGATDPAVRRAVYHLYRGLLGTYNDKANDIVSALPAQQVCEDQGVSKQLHSML